MLNSSKYAVKIYNYVQAAAAPGYEKKTLFLFLNNRGLFENLRDFVSRLNT